MTLRPLIAAGIAALLAQAACATDGGRPLSVTERDTIDACRQHADQVYDRLNRGEIYSIHDPYAPSSGTGLSSNPTGYLSSRYAHEQMIARCVRDTGAGTRAPEVPNAARQPGSQGF